MTFQAAPERLCATVEISAIRDDITFLFKIFQDQQSLCSDLAELNAFLGEVLRSFPTTFFRILDYPSVAPPIRPR